MLVMLVVIMMTIIIMVVVKVVLGVDDPQQQQQQLRLSFVRRRLHARRYFPNANVIGRKFGYGKPNVEIIGIVADARINNEREPAPPMAFYPLAQGTVYGGCVELRIAGDAAARIREIREGVIRSIPICPSIPSEPYVTR